MNNGRLEPKSSAVRQIADHLIREVNEPLVIRWLYRAYVAAGIAKSADRISDIGENIAHRLKKPLSEDADDPNDAYRILDPRPASGLSPEEVIPLARFLYAAAENLVDHPLALQIWDTLAKAGEPFTIEELPGQIATDLPRERFEERNQRLVQNNLIVIEKTDGRLFYGLPQGNQKIPASKKKSVALRQVLDLFLGETLSSENGLSVEQVAERLDIQRNAARSQLKVLEARHLLQHKKSQNTDGQGRHVIHYMASKRLHDILTSGAQRNLMCLTWQSFRGPACLRMDMFTLQKLTRCKIFLIMPR